jgi:hypothetical protein
LQRTKGDEQATENIDRVFRFWGWVSAMNFGVGTQARTGTST